MPTTEINETKENEGSKQPGFFSKFLFLGVLPFLYAIGLGVTILHFAGVHLDTQVKWVEDHARTLFPNKESQKPHGTTNKDEASPGRSSGVAPKNSNGQSTKKDQSNTAQTSPLPVNQLNKDAVTKSPTTPNTAPVAESLGKMDPGSAAKLLSNMSEKDALDNLKQLKPAQQTSIIAEMPADVGAKLTVALANNQELASTTNSSAQLYQHMKPDQIASVLKGIKNNAEVLKQIKQLDPDTASKVISQLDPSVAGWIVTQMN